VTQKVIIDADPGIGDAAAVALAILDREVDVLGVTATAGRVSGTTATRNLQTIIELLDPPKRPRLGSSQAGLMTFDASFGAGFTNSTALNGRTGLGNNDFQVAELHHPHDSAKLMIELTRNSPNEVTLLTLGPLTNVKIACERAPEFLSLLKGLVCLGGSVEVGGDITPAAEFNVYADPMAARSILRSPATKTLVPLDVSGRSVLTFEQLDFVSRIAAPHMGWLLKNLLPFALRTNHEHLGREGLPLHEVVALAAIARPRLFESRSMPMNVEISGELTQGMTVFDRRVVRKWHSNINVLDKVDADGVLDYFTSIVGIAAA